MFAPSPRPEIARRSPRRHLAVVLAGALIVASCGGGDSASTTSESSDTLADAPDVASGTDAPTDETAGSVTINDVTGETTVDVTDENVYVLDGFAGVAILSLDVEPLAIADLFQDPTINAVFGAEGVTLDGYGSIETVAAASPDLIVGIGHPNHLEFEAEYEAIAPAVFPDFTVPWEDQTRLFAEVVGRSDRADRVIATIDERVVELAAQIDDAGLAGGEFSIIQPLAPGFYGYGPGTLSGTLVSRLGFTRSETQSVDSEFGFIEISEELLPEEVDADVVVSITGTDGSASLFDNPVVDVGDVTSADVSPVWTANHALAAWVILDDIESMLFGDGSTVSGDTIDEAWSDLIAAIEADAGETSADSDGSAPDDSQDAVIVITDDIGDVELTSPAERVVALSDEATELVAGLGLRPIGISSARLSEPNSLDGYYLGPDVIGTPEIVGTDTPNLEAIAALEPDFIVAGFADDALGELQQIAPVAVFDIQVPGRWQEALLELGAATGTTERAQSVIDDYDAQVDAARTELEAIAAANPRLAVSYPNYRGGDENFIFDEDFAIAAVIPELGFDLVGSEIADEAFPGVGTLATELLGDLDGLSDTLITLGPTEWERTASATILETLDQPVLDVLLDEGRPSTGPLSAPFYLDAFVSALTAEYG